ncbi:transposase [Dyella choica]|uniref:transposase n=1 Tax=Dyella choica TaxID=1927959 RepID=UPI0018AD4A00|nr:transposase [Dyella choica]
MAYPRNQIVDSETEGFFHCVTRCVRRAFLCGEDTYNGRSYDHRKAWVERRLLELAECFAVGLYAYAVMSNHVHVVMHVNPMASKNWSDKEVAERWVRLFPVRVDNAIDERLCQEKARRLQGDSEQMVELRSRLGSVSWFMRCLNEPIARQANREDGCTGRFWEGRFKCQALLDEQAVLACMVYVDLNPIRAGMATELTASEHTSIRRRLQDVQTKATSLSEALRPLAGMLLAPVVSLRTLDYVELVDWSGRMVRDDKRGSIAAEVPAVLAQLGLRERQWRTQMLGIESQYWRAVGTMESLVAKARALGQCWLKGAGKARQPDYGWGCRGIRPVFRGGNEQIL